MYETLVKALPLKTIRKLSPTKFSKMNAFKSSQIVKIKIDHDLLAKEREKLIEKNVTKTRVTNSISDEVIEKVCIDLKKKLGVDTLAEKDSDLKVLIMITGLTQNGGTNRIIGNGIRYTYDGYDLDAKTLNDIIKKHQKNRFCSPKKKNGALNENGIWE